MIIGIDFETYYDAEYSLTAKDMSMTQYIRSSKFQAHGAAIRAANWPESKWYAAPEVKDALQQFDWSECALMAHNAQFDGLIASHYYGVVPKKYICTLSMAQPLVGYLVGVGLDNVGKYFGGEGKIEGSLLNVKGKRVLTRAENNALGFYSCRDVDQMWMIYEKLLPWLNEEEMGLIDMTIRMYADPKIEVDQPLARAALRNEQLLRAERVIRAAQILGPGAEKVLSSSAKFALALKVQGIIPPTKTSPRTSKEIYAFAKSDLEFQALKDSPNEKVAALVEARLAVKSTLGITRAARLISHSAGGLLPIALNYAKAHTFRWSGGDKMNPQNFIRGGDLRKALRAPLGYQIVVVDSSQIEARLLLWLAEQWDKLEEFVTDDPYCILAQEVYSREITKERDPAERFVGKVGILGLGFGMAALRYQHTLAAGVMGDPVQVDITTAQRVVHTYRGTHKKVVVLWNLFNRFLSSMASGRQSTLKDGLFVFKKDEVSFSDGLTLHYNDLRYGEDGFSYQTNARGGRAKIYGAKFVQNIVQFLERQVVARQTLAISERYPVIMMTHDEAAYLARNSEADEALQFGLDQFRIAPDWCKNIPLDAEGGYARNYVK